MMVRNGESGWVDNVFVTESLDSDFCAASL
ncbi:MAG: hypothetical protein Ct9H90mP14_2560 [Methanobacteriota archaeon]|nr:MAG: hypothetical protein Ct9H90mP14_2560 [Euryarchaeota archaeon]